MSDRRGKVLVGMSGGVDSSVSAALLKEQGYEVVGAFIKTWSPDWLPCTWREERRDAMRAAATIGIPLITVDLEEEYKRGVVDYFVGEYGKGRTPNPDVMCNKEIKFGAFLKYALEKGFDYVATGHYARNVDGELHMGADPEKDQTYFLWTLTNEQLEKILFPVGNYQKSEVRELAQKYALPVADKKDSQGICFLGKVDMREFLIHYLGEKRGDVLNEEGSKIGEHQGAIYYTLGQRHGFSVTTEGIMDMPHYVVERDVDSNTLTVSTKKPEQSEEYSRKEMVLEDVVLRAKVAKAEARVRYRGELIPVEIDGDKVRFDKAVTVESGQSVVLYDGDHCVGGGIAVSH